MTVFGKKEENALNIQQPTGVRTRASIAATQVKIKADTSVTAKKSNENIKQEPAPPPPPVDLVTVLKARHADITKPSTKSRRISNEFEKTEESLYVSALEEIPADASLRLSNDGNKRKKSDVGTLAFKQPSTSSSKHEETLKADSEDVFEDARGDNEIRKLPSGAIHFDRENWNDPFQVSHYAMDIFDYLTQQEHKYQVRDYISVQPELSKWMRSLLVDWMVEVQESFELNHETLYLAVKIVDSYLGKEVVSKDSLQLVGAAALLIACKYDVSNHFYCSNNTADE